MNVKELKIHILRGLIRPEYFYIPLFEKKSGVFIRVTDQNGEPVYIRKISFTYRTYQLWHAVYKDGSSWVTSRDETSKGYAFDADTQWTWPPAIPNPSVYQILPVPDFTSNTPEIDGGEVAELSSQYIVFTFEEPKNLIELKNFPAGIYYVSVSSADVVYDAEKYKINKIEYFPTYYNDYERSVSHTSGSCQIDKSGRFSGFDMSENTDSTDHHPTGYDFYCLTQKFKNNTMPVVVNMQRIYKFKYVAFWMNVPNIIGLETTGGIDEYGPDAYMTYRILAVPGFKVYVDDEYVGAISSEFAMQSWYGWDRVTETASVQTVLNSILEYGYVFYGSDYHDGNDYDLGYYTNWAFYDGRYYNYHSYGEIMRNGNKDISEGEGSQYITPVLNIASSVANGTYKLWTGSYQDDIPDADYFVSRGWSGREHIKRTRYIYLDGITPEEYDSFRLNASSIEYDYEN